MKTTRKHLILFITIVLTLALMLASCGGADNGEGNDPDDPNAAITHVVETAMMAITQTEAVQPSTSTPLPSSTPLPTATTIPTMQASPTTAAGVPTATSSFVQPTNVTSSCDVGAFVSDVTVPDGTVFEASKEFTKTWEIKNNGTCTWNSAYQVVYYGGQQMAADTIYTFTDEDVEPGETVQISVKMTAPASNGNYTGFWILRNDQGQNFFVDGGSIYVQITVGTATQAPSATPGGTPTNDPPTISITSDEADLKITTAEDIVFTALTDDTEDGPFDPSEISWYVNDVFRKTGNPAAMSSFAVGTYTITAKVTDSDGNTTTSNALSLEVVAP